MAADNDDSIDFDSPEFRQAVDEAKNRTTHESAAPVVVEDKPVVVAEEKPVVAPADPAKPNYGDYLSTLTEGFIKDEDTLKSYLPKVKGYDDLETKLREAEASKIEFKNDETRRLYELWAAGDKDAVRNYIRETEKDYKTMSDIDVRREALSKEHPNWSGADVELEIRHKYGNNLEKRDLSTIDREVEPDEYAEAVAHNKEVEKNLELLAVHARDDRYSLIDQQSKIELPQIKKADAPSTPQGPTEAEIAEANQRWIKSVKDELPKLENIKMTIGDKEVEYVSTDDEKSELASYMETFNIFNLAKESGWYNADGSPNPLKIAQDVQWLKNREKITKSFATQVKTETTKDVMKKIKNTDDTYRAPEGEQVFDTLEEAAWDAINKAKAKRRAAQE